MNVSRLKTALSELADAAADLAEICQREHMEQFAPFWRSVVASAQTIQAGPMNRTDIDALAQDVVSAFSHRPGGFMDMYVIRASPEQQALENDRFDRVRKRVLDAAVASRESAAEGEIDPLRVRRRLVELESWFLERQSPNEAARIRALLETPQLEIDAVRSFLADVSLAPNEDMRALVEALAEELRAEIAESRVVAVDYTDGTISIYETGDNGAKLIGTADQSDISSLRKQGLRMGATYGGSGLLWAFDDREGSIWLPDRVVLKGSKQRLGLAGQTLSASEIREVVSFVGSDWVRRGVALDLTSGERNVVVDEYDEIARMDPTYGRNDFLMSDARWIHFLGRDLAAWLGVSHDDRAFGRG
jgi:hypothetical protein